MDTADSRTSYPPAASHVARSNECIRRSRELIQHSDAAIRESADLLIMMPCALLDAATVRDRFHLFYAVAEEDWQPCAVECPVSASRAD